MDSKTLDELELARLFHDTYERLAPEYGYETRPDTRAWDAESPNGRLMIAVCKEVLIAAARDRLREAIKKADAVMEYVRKWHNRGPGFTAEGNDAWNEWLEARQALQEAPA